MRQPGRYRVGVARRASLQLRLLVSAGCVMAGLSLVLPLMVAAATLAQGFTARQAFIPGTLVARDTGRGEAVVAASTGSVERLAGVVIAADDAALITNAAAPIQVATGGSTRVLVSDLAGPIQAGDHLTASPLKGVGMKATGSVRAVGVAEGDFTAASAGEWRELRGRDGRTTRVRVGSVAVRVEVADYTAPPERSIVPAFLQQFSNQVAGRPVSALRVVVSFVIMLVALVAVGSMLFAAIKSSITSMGRNPLAARHIYQGLWRAFGISIVVLGLAIAATYCIMRL